MFDSEVDDGPGEGTEVELGLNDAVDKSPTVSSGIAAASRTPMWNSHHTDDEDDRADAPRWRSRTTGRMTEVSRGFELTRFDQVTPAPPSDSGAAATVELEQ